MRSIARLIQLTSLAALLAAPLAASAQPGALTVHDPFFETGRFMTRNLRLNGGGNSLVVAHGGNVVGTLELKQRCHDCPPNGRNQIIIGLGGDAQAQACIWNGGPRSKGWEAARFALDVPDVPGVYEVRVRDAQAGSCRDAPRWWNVDRPGGPTGDSTIGVIVVEGDPVPPPPAERPWRAVMRDIDQTTGDLDDVAQKLERTTKGRSMNRRDQDDARRLSKRAADLVRTLDDLHGELDDAMARALHETRRDDRPGRIRPRPFVRPTIVVVAAPEPDFGPQPMAPDAYSRLLKRIDDAAFPDAQLQTLRDAINADAYFLTRQALGVLNEFSFDNHKVDAAAMMCPRIVEPGALPELLGAFTFDNYRDELRSATHNRCGYQP